MCLTKDLNMLHMVKPKWFRNETIEGLAKHIRGGAVEHTLCCGVEEHNVLIDVDRDDRIHRGVDDSGQTGFTVAPGRLVPLPLRHIMEDVDRKLDAVCLITDWRRLDDRPAFLAARADPPTDQRFGVCLAS